MSLILLTRFLGIFWCLGIMIIGIRLFACALFNREIAPKDFAAAVLWPLFLVTGAGRARINKIFQ